MTNKLTIALSQQNFTVGDIHGNVEKILVDWKRAKNDRADIVVYSECCVSGYPMEDLALKPAFQQAVHQAVEKLAAETGSGPALLISAPWSHEGQLYNAALLLAQGKIKDIRFKYNLPNYGVFDEKRIFKSGPLPEPIPFQGTRLGVMICEDMWHEEVAPHLCAQEAEILIVMNGSPYEVDKPGQRHRFAERRVFETAMPFIYVNQYGGQDELVFDGLSFILDHTGREVVRMEDFCQDYQLTEWVKIDGMWQCQTKHIGHKCDDLESIWQAMVLGLRDYVEKNRFKGVILGLSGGIDSAISAAVAVDALGSERVRGVLLPSRYTSQMSIDDAHALAKNLDIRLDTISIEPMFATMQESLAPLFKGLPANTTEENMQARIRANLLMAMSNKFDHMLLTTGNKSEMSVGYATLYGDMCGGYSVLKDVYKTTVYRLSEWRNKHTPKNVRGPGGVVIPENTITRAPSAELKDNQKDQDSLPPYEVLDAILEALVEDESSEAEIISQGFDAKTVLRVSRLLYAAEYKREQSPPGVKISSKAFGADRRYPITNRFVPTEHGFEE